MKTFTDMKKDYLLSRKSGNKVKSALFSTIIGEVELETKRSGKSVDDVLTSTIIKLKKNLEQNIKYTEDTEAIEMEISLISEYIPSELTEDEIKDHVTRLVQEHGKDMKIIMPLLKVIDGMNMKVASQFVREL
jgi:uncharacterized protein YqeY